MIHCTLLFLAVDVETCLKYNAFEEKIRTKLTTYDPKINFHYRCEKK